MKLGGEPKKVAILVVLLLIAAFVFVYNTGDEDFPEAESRPLSPVQTVAPQTRGVTPGTPPPEIARDPRRGTQKGREEFRPRIGARRPEERIDPAKIDPTLRLDLLARLQEVKVQGGERSLFEFGQAAPPKTPDVTIVPKPLAKALGPEPPPAEPSKLEPAKPPAPPIPFKFYGFVSPAAKQPGPRRAFFLEGEEIHVAGEGEVIKRRYKVVRIGVNSAVVEDMQHDHQQTLPLEAEMG
jgi:hypothetical protein